MLLTKNQLTAVNSPDGNSDKTKDGSGPTNKHPSGSMSEQVTVMMQWVMSLNALQVVAGKLSSFVMDKERDNNDNFQVLMAFEISGYNEDDKTASATYAQRASLLKQNADKNNTTLDATAGRFKDLFSSLNDVIKSNNDIIQNLIGTITMALRQWNVG